MRRRKNTTGSQSGRSNSLELDALINETISEASGATDQDEEVDDVSGLSEKTEELREVEDILSQSPESPKSSQSSSAQNMAQKVVASTNVNASESTGGSCDMPQPELQSLAKLAFQYKAFKVRVPEVQQERLIGYYPYLELRKRTLPLPNIPEYLVALNADKKGSKKLGVQEQLTTAFTKFKDAVILLVRKNYNTQIIFPGKSTTSYAMKKYAIKEFIWVPTIEFSTFNYANLPKNAELQYPKDTGDKLGIVKGGRLTKSESRGGLVGRSLGYDIDITLCNSVQVALSYLKNEWLNLKPNKVQERFNTKIRVFFEESSKADGAMTLKFLGTVNLDKVRGEKIIQERQPEADDILAEFSAEELDFDTTLFNPRKSTKSLPMFDDQVTYSQRSSRRR